MINLRERMLPTSAGVEPATSWSPVGRRIQLSHRGRLLLTLETKCSISFTEAGPQTYKLLSKMIFILQSQSHGITEGHGKSSIAPLFQSGTIINYKLVGYHRHFCQQSTFLIRLLIIALNKRGQQAVLIRYPCKDQNMKTVYPPQRPSFFGKSYKGLKPNLLKYKKNKKIKKM